MKDQPFFPIAAITFLCFGLMLLPAIGRDHAFHSLSKPVKNLVEAGDMEVSQLSTLHCTGNQPVYAELTNGYETSVDSVRVEWTFNGVQQAAVHWMAPPSLGFGNTIRLLLGKPGFALGQSHAIKVWIASTNGLPDLNHQNDTLTVQFKLDTLGMSGTYTIGGQNPDFPNFSSAVERLTQVGVCGPVTFKVRNGPYREQIRIGEIPGTDAANQVTFESESGDSTQVLLVFQSTMYYENYTLQIAGADWLTFRKMTIQGEDLNYGRAVEIGEGAHHIRFENNIIKGSAGQYSGDGNVVIYSAFPDNEGHIYRNNLIQNGTYGMVYGALPVPNRPAEEAAITDGLVVEGPAGDTLIITANTFDNQRWTGIYLTDRGDAPTWVSHNRFLPVPGNYYNLIVLEKCNYTTIEDNVLDRTARGDLIRMEQGSHVTVRGNRIENFNSGTAVSGQYLQHLLIADNDISGGDYSNGIIVANNASQTGPVQVLDNRISNLTYGTAIFLGRVSAFEISRNRIDKVQNGKGIHLDNCQGQAGNTVSGNRLSRLVDSPGIDLNLVQSARVFNNAIEAGGTAQVAGIASNAGVDIDYLYNTVQMTNRYPDAQAFANWQGKGQRVFNNIFANTGGGLAVEFQFDNSGDRPISDYNDLFSSGPVVGLLNSDGELGNFSGKLDIQKAGNLAEWQAFTALDEHSLGVNPGFSNAGGLRPTHIYLNGAALPQPQILNDLDGVVRDGQKPDIGALEFSPLAVDAALERFQSPVPPFAVGTAPVQVVLLNNGADTLRQARIDWAVNGVAQPAYAWAGVLAAGDTAVVSIGTFTTRFFAQYRLQAWSSLPNNQPDQLPLNDTISAGPFYPALIGIYSIGGTKPDFPSFGAALSAMKNGGIAGAVVFKVRNGRYEESLILDPVMGAGSQRTITFESESGDSTAVVLANTDNSHTLLIRGAQWLTFRKMTLENLNPGFGVAIFAQATSGRIVLENNVFQTDPAMKSNNLAVFDYAYDGQVLIRRNRFLNGQYGLRADYLELPFSIEQNQFENQYYGAISAHGSGRVRVAGNVINTRSDNYSFAGITLSGGLKHAEVSGNILPNIPSGRGLYLWNLDSSLVANNFIHIAHPKVNNFFESAGIYALDVKNTSFLYNTVHITNKYEGSTALAFQGGAGNVFYNNIFANTGPGPVITGDFNAESPILASDYNDFYVKGKWLAFWKNEDLIALSNWQASLRQDTHSVSLDPLFVDSTSYQVRQAGVNNAGKPLVNVTTDIQGQPRDPLEPDMGADEFDILQNDLSVAAILSPKTGCDLQDTAKVSVRIANFGGRTMSGFDLAYQVDTSAVVVENAGTFYVPAGKELAFTFAKPANLTRIGQHALRAWVVLPGDANTGNDTLISNLNNFLRVTATISRPDTVCQGSPISLQAGGGRSYKWSNGYSGSYQTVAPNQTTTYRVTVTSLDGCTDTASVTITVDPKPPVPVITASGSTTLCPGDSVALSSSATSNITWSNGKTTPTITVKSGGEYAVRYQQGACQVTSAVTKVVAVPVGIEVTSGFTTICRGSSVTLTARSAGTVKWSGGQTSAAITIQPAVTTQYAVQVTTPQGCAYRDSIIITVRPAQQPSSVTNPVPASGSIGLTQPIRFSWYPSDDATYYELYLWEKGLPRPAKPTLANVTAIFAEPGLDLVYGAAYYWQIAARNSCFTTFSDTFHFRTAGRPDLSLEQFRSPKETPSGATLSFTWTVKNKGNSSTGSQSWNDYLWLSTDEDLRLADDILLGYWPNPGFLPEGESYTSTRQVKMPQSPFSGRYFIFVTTDNKDAYCLSPDCPPGSKRGFHSQLLYELDEQNNFAFDTLLIYPTPAPDLQTAAINAPMSVFNGDTLTVTYATANTGNANNYQGWKDYIYLSADSVFNIKAVLVKIAEPVAVKPQVNAPGKYVDGVFVYDQPVLRTGDLLLHQEKITVPLSLSGKIFVFLKTDAGDHVFEAAGENNNIRRMLNPINVILRPPADLQVSAVTLPATALAGRPMDISWTVVNRGAASFEPGFWADSIFLCSTDQLTEAGIIWRGYTWTSLYRPIGAGESVQKRFSLLLPNGLKGRYYAFVKADARNLIYEYTFDNNNLNRSAAPVNIELPDYPDLTVTAVEAPGDTLWAGDRFALKWTISNKGQAAAAAWNDQVFLSRDSAANAAPDYGFFFYTNLSPLNPNAAYTRTATALVPELSKGRYYFHVVTDAENEVYEYQGEQNNRRRSALPVYFSSRPVPGQRPVYADLAVTSATVPAGGMSGKAIDVAWTVRNNGPSRTSTYRWTDRVYLSKDSLPDQADLVLGLKYNSSYLDSAAQYSRTLSVELPNGISGRYYVFVQADYGGEVDNDTIKGNNRSVLLPIDISLTPAPDLIALTWVVPDTVFAGQQWWVSYSVKNHGPGPVPAPGSWEDRFLFSGSPDLSQPGVERFAVGGIARNAPLDSGAVYTDSVLWRIPSYAAGNYFVVFATDIRDQVYEFGRDGNNVQSKLITVLSPQKAVVTPDLVISRVHLPDTLLLGRSATVSYTIKNEGSIAANGLLKDALYFSVDDKLDGALDPAFTNNLTNINLMPGDSLRLSRSDIVQEIADSAYYGIGRTNAGLSIPETRLDNNIALTPARVRVAVRALALDVPDFAQLQPGDPEYYKVAVGAGLDLLITLGSNSDRTGWNEVWVALNRVPSASSYDFSQQNRNGLNQTVLIPGTQAGVYYIAIHARTDVGKPQNIRILARALPFSITSIDPAKVGAGVVTTTLQGAGFRPGIQVFLRDSSGLIIRTAKVLDFRSSMELLLNWNLEGVAPGKYDVVARNPDASTQILPKGLTVSASTGIVIAVVELNPDVIRFGKSAFSAYSIINAGNVDIAFLKAEVILPKEVQVADVRIKGATGFTLSQFTEPGTPSEDYKFLGDYKIVPYLIKGLKPGDAVRLELTLRGFRNGYMPITLRAHGYTTPDFVRRQVAILESNRQYLASNLTAQIEESPVLRDFFSDPLGFRDTLLGLYFRAGILAPADTAGLELACRDCTGHRFSPGLSPGTGIFNKLVFEPGETYRWEINDPLGQAGKDPGWDLLKSYGSLEITATPQKRFTISIHSLSSATNEPDFLTTWSPGYDHRWPIAVAATGIVGFDTSKFALDDSEFRKFNSTCGGAFRLGVSGDTLYLYFIARKPAFGETGCSGGPGQPGKPGGKGGPGGNGKGNVPPGKGGQGGQGGQGSSGGDGGDGGDGDDGQGGGSGGSGGDGGPPNDGKSGSGGSGGKGGKGGKGGQDGQKGEDGDPVPDGWEPWPDPTDDQQTTQEEPPESCNPVTTTKPNEQCEKLRKGAKCLLALGGCAFDIGSAIGVCGVLTPAVGIGQAACGAYLLWKIMQCGSSIYDCATGSSADAGLESCQEGSNKVTLEVLDQIFEKFIRELDLDISWGEILVAIADAGVDCFWKCDQIPVVSSCDPNEIVGPTGFGEPRFVSVNKRLDYTIYFENDPNFASGPAQRVEVRQALDPHVDPFSFRLGEFGFGPYTFKSPTNVSSYTSRVQLSDTLGMDLEVTAGLDIVKREVFWILQSIDRASGASPYDPLKGFLPVNDSLGAGQGFVKYSIWPESTARTGDTILARADIYFDQNAVVPTNTAVNVVDAVPPSSELKPLPPVVYADSVVVRWSGRDDLGGSGLQNYDLYLAKDDSLFTILAPATTDTSLVFNGQGGSRYAFYTRARDNTDNLEADKNKGDYSVLLAPRPDTVRLQAGTCRADSVGVWQKTLTSKAGYDSLVVITTKVLTPLTATPEWDNIRCYGAADGRVKAVQIGNGTMPYVYLWSTGARTATIQNLRPGTYSLTATDAKGCITTALVTITQPDSLKVAIEVIPPAGTKPGSATASVSGGKAPYQILWSNGQSGATATGLEPGSFSVQVTDANGCSKTTPFSVVTGVETIPGLSRFELYPNPSSGKVYLDLTLAESTDMTVSLHDVNGRVVLLTKYRLTAGRNQMEINAEPFPAGVYLVRLAAAKGVASKRVVLDE